MAARRVDDVAARYRDVVGQPGTLRTDRILGHLDQDRLAGFEHLFDFAILALGTEVIPVDLTGIDHSIAAPADVDEGGFH
jgi:hypothetical protein